MLVPLSWHPSFVSIHSLSVCFADCRSFCPTVSSQVNPVWDILREIVAPQQKWPQFPRQLSPHPVLNCLVPIESCPLVLSAAAAGARHLQRSCPSLDSIPVMSRQGATGGLCCSPWAGPWRRLGRAACPARSCSWVGEGVVVPFYLPRGKVVLGAPGRCKELEAEVLLLGVFWRAGRWQVNKKDTAFYLIRKTKLPKTSLRRASVVISCTKSCDKWKELSREKAAFSLCLFPSFCLLCCLPCSHWSGMWKHSSSCTPIVAARLPGCRWLE